MTFNSMTRIVESCHTMLQMFCLKCTSLLIYYRSHLLLSLLPK